MGQDSLFLRQDDCKQANEGQQIGGNENSAAGLNDQSNGAQQKQNPTNTPSSSSPIPTNRITPIPPVTPPVTPPSTLTVSKLVECNFDYSVSECPNADQFTINATTGNGSSYTFSI